MCISGVSLMLELDPIGSLCRSFGIRLKSHLIQAAIVTVTTANCAASIDETGNR